MGLIEKTVCRVESLFEKLVIPEYQRPYRWKRASVLTMYNDISQAKNQGLEEYRLGSVILHKKGNEYNIVDGQQRVTTLLLLLKALEESIIDLEYSQASVSSIKSNYKLLADKVKELDSKEKKALSMYVKNNCTFVKIVTDSQEEAFQFFDSQNARGRALDPHDLLKSYHLREMSNEDEQGKIKVVNKWENTNQKRLVELFEHFLFPLTKWYKGKDGIGYAVDKIEAFKGIRVSNNYNYAIYHKASNLYIEEQHRGNVNELNGVDRFNQFQLTQPIIAGKRFFDYTSHYLDLIEKVKKRVKACIEDEYIPTQKTGDKYVYRLFLCTLVFFADRFGIKHVSDGVIKKLYKWSYVLRLGMHAVYLHTVNKYAKGCHEKLEGVNIFAFISDMKDAGELDLLEINFQANENARSNYGKIVEFIEKEV